jgi:hypothetical protein
MSTPAENAACRRGSAMQGDAKMTKVSQRRDIADTGRKRAPAEHDGALDVADLERIAAAGGTASGGHGGNAVWPPPPGRN